ncbi:MAG: hypothetical protein ACJ77D_06870 [Chloroflexota bacterium]
MAGQLGYCGLDRSRQPLTGEEIRACWEGWPDGVATGTSVPLTIAAAPGAEDTRPPLAFVEVAPVPSADGPDQTVEEPPLVPPKRVSAEPGWSLWGDLEP